MRLERQAITPHLWFDKEAKEAARFYKSIFPRSRVISTTTLHHTPSGDVDVVSFELSGQKFMAISGGPVFKFNEAISFVVDCETQEEIDYYWKRLSADPGAEQCGWLKDKYGLSWQITPTAMSEMLQNGTRAQVARVTKAFLKMKKIDIAVLRKAYTGRGKARALSGKTRPNHRSWGRPEKRRGLSTGMASRRRSRASARSG